MTEDLMVKKWLTTKIFSFFLYLMKQERKKLGRYGLDYCHLSISQKKTLYDLTCYLPGTSWEERNTLKPRETRMEVIKVSELTPLSLSEKDLLLIVGTTAIYYPTTT